jgi:hypothetical protein
MLAVPASHCGEEASIRDKRRQSTWLPQILDSVDLAIRPIMHSLRCDLFRFAMNDGLVRARIHPSFLRFLPFVVFVTFPLSFSPASSFHPLLSHTGSTPPRHHYHITTCG